MTNSKELFNELISRVRINEDKSEIQSIIYLLLEKRLKLTKTEILANKAINSVDPSSFDSSIEQINANKPIQYILGEAAFYGRTFTVNSAVLIPRPETELLIHEIVSHNKSKSPKILDIGTGSGCIAISLALEIDHSTVYASDISKGALEVARQNAKTLGAGVTFLEHNILTDEISVDQFDLIVSNPPYISQQEKESMKSNVLSHEPHLALFAPPEDPLAFYKSIASKSKKSLLPGGTVWVEINEHFGNEVALIFKKESYHPIRIIKDLDQKDRIVTASI